MTEMKIKDTEEIDQLGDLGLGERIILKRI
jgi:hypothetical protein